MFVHKTPKWVKWLYPNLIWDMPTSKEPTIYLTFDDGPIPKLTPFILDVLADYNAQATFFCVGENLLKNSKIAEMSIDAGHTLANHTYNHMNGWSVDSPSYIANVAKCHDRLEKLGQGKKLLRPPYGRIKRNQIKILTKEYDIVMWDVLTGDFSAKITPKSCLEKSIKATADGSIVVFHDNVKAENNIKYTLPRYLEHFSKQGYLFKAL